MKIKLLKDVVLTETIVCIVTVTRKMVRERAVELAVINGRTAHEVSKPDWEQAKQELTDKPDNDSPEAVLESAPESKGWDEICGSTGNQVPEIPGDDEDEEGRSNSERLVEKGIDEAAHDQKRQAAKTQR
jgi:hypothetical protein